MIKEVIVKTNQNETKIIQETENKLKILLKSKPEKGKANIELINFLSKKYNASVRIIKGKTKKKKVVEILPN